MYKISVPVANSVFQRADREKTVKMLKSIGTQRVMLALDTYETDAKKHKEVLTKLKENTEYLKKEGFEVGAWTWTFWFKGENNYTHMKSTAGNDAAEFICPSDSDFRDFAGGYIKDIAKTGVDIILFDDDYRYGYLGNGMCCICENHLKLTEEILGEKLPENFKDYLISGGENKYRTAWIKANRQCMLKFAEDMRKSLDEVNPEIRLGVCACMSVWDFDGASPAEISKALAGNTKPFLRLIGAPYWAVNKAWGNRLQDVVELERMELSWCDGEDIEIIGEGDVWPRPRFKCPASYLEGFDTALRADGGFDGILKYVMDYTSSAGYETGYVDAHIRNIPNYEGIDNIFSDKNATGVRVYESMRKYERTQIPKVIRKDEEIYDLFYSVAARMLTSCSIPTVYRGQGVCGIAFGENAKYLPESAFENGLILDMRAAEILSEQGTDVGFEEKIEEISATEEYFVSENEYVPITVGSNAYRLKLKDKAKVQSYFVNENGKYPASYIYENADGQRFFVFAFDGYYADENLYRQYTRSRQIAENVKWLSEKSLPAFISGNPDLYVMCKKNDKAMAVGLWNFFADGVYEPEVVLDREYKSIKFVNCTGEIKGNEVFLSNIPPFGFAAFEVE